MQDTSSDTSQASTRGKGLVRPGPHYALHPSVIDASVNSGTSYSVPESSKRIKDSRINSTYVQDPPASSHLYLSLSGGRGRAMVVVPLGHAVKN